MYTLVLDLATIASYLFLHQPSHLNSVRFRRQKQPKYDVWVFQHRFR